MTFLWNNVYRFSVHVTIGDHIKGEKICLQSSAK